MAKYWKVEFEVEADDLVEVQRLFQGVQDSRKAMIINEEYNDEDDALLARIGYNKKEDAFELLISTDGGSTWGMSVSSQCRRCAEDKPDAEPEFIHCGIIQRMKDAIRYGFRIVY